MEDEIIKDCPCCARGVKVVEDSIGAYVWCTNCKCIIEPDRRSWTREKAIESWNRRNTVMFLYTNEKVARKSKLEGKISGVVSKDLAEADLRDYSPKEVGEAIKDLYFVEHYEDMETNGRQVDFWITYIIDDRKFVYSGSWYYGDSLFKEEK